MIENFDVSYAPRPGYVQRIAISTTPGNTALDADLAGNGKLRVKAMGAEGQFLFGDGTAAVVLNQTGSGNDVGWSLAAGDGEDFFLTNQTHIAHVGSAAGFLVIYRAGKERIGK